MEDAGYPFVVRDPRRPPGRCHEQHQPPRCVIPVDADGGIAESQLSPLATDKAAAKTAQVRAARKTAVAQSQISSLLYAP
jgi:hypothetical protein